MPERDHPTFIVTRAGLFTTVQDLGRYRRQRYGVSVSGAMDRVAFRLANRLVGNPDTAAGLEITVQGPDLFVEDTTMIAVTGADLSPSLTNQPLPMWTAVEIKPGDHLHFGSRKAGARAYLAVAGGIDVPVVLGSRATHIRSRLGGLDGRALRKGDHLHTCHPAPDSPRYVGRTIPAHDRPPYSTSPTLRIMKGPQADCFSSDTLETLVRSTYTISRESDRMGFRLSGHPLVLAGATEVVSDATTFGNIQVAADQQPILLMADCQTTGGYPKIASISSVDLSLAAQLLPEDAISFSWISVHEAQTQLKKLYERMHSLIPALL